MVMDECLADLARSNSQSLKGNSYPGRGLVVGMDYTGQRLLQACWIMGRSINSRSRVFKADNYGSVRTEPLDSENAGDTSLTIYRAMGERHPFYVVSNGKQTETVLSSGDLDINFREALYNELYEPDKPHFTPRITAMCAVGKQPVAQISLIKRCSFGEGCDRRFYSYDEFEHGFGYCVTTYAGDGDPLPSFKGKPYLLSLNGGLREVAESLWGLLNEENRVALIVKEIPLKGGASRTFVINKYSQKSK
jgi:hypothetical protein